MLFSLGELRVVLDKIATMTSDEVLKNIRSNGDGTYGRERYESISKKSKDSIIQFPVLISNSVPSSDMVMVLRALERQYATYVRLSAEMSTKTIDANGSRAGYLDQFSDRSLNNHRSTGNKIMDIVGGDDFEGYTNQFMASEAVAIEQTQDVKYRVRLANENSSKLYLEDLRMKPLNDLYNNPRNLLQERNTLPARSDNNSQRANNVLNKQLVDNDIKKANELLPTTLALDIKVNHQSGMYNEQILVGVKAIAHLVESEEMIYNLANTAKGKKSFFRFIQWTTGEIQFLRDYIMDLDRMKRMALDTRKSHWFRSLYKRRKDKNLEHIRKALGFKAKGSNPLPTSTVVLTMDEVEYIMSNYNIDLLNDKKAVRSILDQYLLLGFVILDSASELGYFMFDGDTDYQVYGYSALEKESQGKTDMKAMLSLVNGR